MDLKSPKYISSSHHTGVRKGNPFVDSSSVDPVGAGTPGRPVFSFSVGNSVSRKKTVSSKWNDAEKWLISDQNQHLDGFANSADFVARKSSSGNYSNGFGIKQNKTKVISEKTEEKVSIFKDNNHHHHHNSFDVLKDKFTNESETNFLKFEHSEPLSETFIFKDSSESPTLKSRDIGTEMTPLGSSTTSRCPTPFKTMSPPRHNTPATRSGPLLDPNGSLDIGELRDCHLAKLKLGTTFDSGVSNWSSREEEEEDVSKSLRRFEMSSECRKSVSESRSCAWGEEEKTKCCLRYQREEAKIQAWVDLEKAKAEAQSRKLEVKIQKMRSKFEEKMMREMANVHKKAEELRVAARLEHTEKIRKATEEANTTINQHVNMYYARHNNGSCCCFPCTNLHH